MEKQENRPLDDKTLKKLTALVIDIHSKKKDEFKALRRDRRLHNTKLLLIHYKELCQSCNDAIYSATQLSIEQDYFDINDLLTDDNRDLFIQSVKDSAVRTLIMVAHVQSMLQTYKKACELSMRSEDMRRYRVIEALHLADETLTPIQIAKNENVELRTIYRDMNEAYNTLSIYFFGIDGLDR